MLNIPAETCCSSVAISSLLCTGVGI